MHARLSLMMVLQYIAPGTWVPVYSVLLKDLGFTPTEVSWAFSTSAFGCMIAPIVWGQIADRYMAIERCILVCGAALAGLQWWLSTLTDPTAVFFVSLGIWFFAVPSFSLGATLAFRHLENPEREFGRVRLFGTLGWILGSWTLTAWMSLQNWWSPEKSPDLADALRIASLFSFAYALYSLTLPKTPPQAAAEQLRPKNPLAVMLDAPLNALKMFRQRSLATYMVCVFGSYVSVAFGAQLMPLLLEDRGVPRPWIPSVLTLAQSLEILSLATLPLLLGYLGTKGTLMLGLLAWTTNTLVPALGGPLWLVASCSGLHGLFVCTFLITGQLFVNKHARADFRASAQGVLQMINGFGILAGHKLVGTLRDAWGDQFEPLFGVAAGIGVGLVCIFSAGFTGKVQETARTEPSPSLVKEP